MNKYKIFYWDLDKEEANFIVIDAKNWDDAENSFYLDHPEINGAMIGIMISDMI